MDERVPISQWVQRWYYVLASHRPSQLGWRAFKLLQRRFSPLRPASVSLPAEEELFPRANSGLEQILQRHLNLRTARGSLPERARALLSGEFSFLNQPRQLGPLGDAPLESVEPVSHLWRFHLQYQEFLLDLVAASELSEIAEARQQIWPILHRWIQTHTVDERGASSDAWHPFCTSRRIAVWLMLWQADVIPAEHRQAFARCLELQTRFLERHLEWDLRGNHLLENLRTLVLAGAAWQGEQADRRLNRAIRLCEVQFREQILPSGEHFERSPMYHAQMLSAVLDMRDATRNVRPSFADVCQQTATCMAQLLGGILHPDGHVPLLSDSAFEETPCPAILLQHAVRPGETSADVPGGAVGARVAGDYWTWRSGDDFLLFDHGPVGANDLPAHAHNDLLSIEASLRGRRLIVDSGVFDYDTSEMRRYCRSTAAHNVLQLDGAEQCDLWSRFRMGRRGGPTNFARGSDGDYSWAAATHNAYAGIGVPLVGRWIACRPQGPWIVADWVDGAGKHTLDDWIHLAPDVEVQQQGEQSVVLRVKEVAARLRFHTPGKLSIEVQWSCPDFGVRTESPVIRFHHTAQIPCIIVWSLEWEDATGLVDVQWDGRVEPIVTWQAGDEQLSWTPCSLV